MAPHSSPARRKRNRWRKECLRLRLILASAITCLVERDDVHSSDRDPPPNCNFASSPACSSSEIFRDRLQSLLESGVPCAAYHKSWSNVIEQPSRGQRQRNIFPLPKICAWFESVSLEGLSQDVCIDVVNACLSALNFLNYGMKLGRCIQPACLRPTLAQLSVIEHVSRRVVRFLSKMEHLSAPLNWESGFDHYEHPDRASETLRASSVDLPASAATCDPLDLVSSSLKATISQASHIFPHTGSKCHLPHTICKQGDKQEYIKLTSRELLCGKLRLRTQVDAIGGVFTVRKKEEGRQRKIWNGSLISELAAPPPMPRRLANPSSFLDIFAEGPGVLRFSKRDASTYFDTLRVPVDLQPWLGQPGIICSDLINIGGLTAAQIEALLDGGQTETLGSTTVLYPVHVVWPMGFSWSSAVAQDCTLACCTHAGIAETSIVSPEYEGPTDLSELCFVATDDVLLTHTDEKRARVTLRNLDESFAEHGIPKNCAKDVDMDDCIVGLGCHLCSTPALAEPEEHRLYNLVCAIIHLLQNPACSPKAFSHMLGVLQWLYLLQRPMFSILDESYRFILAAPDRTKRVLPIAVQNEVLTALLLLPLLPAGLDRKFLQEVFACDAAPDFGFGVASAACDEVTSRELCRLGERRGDYVKLFQEESQTAGPTRLGRPHRLNMQQSDFKVLVSSRAKYQAHSGVLEAHGLLLALRCVAQDRSKHHSRVPILIDAKSILGAASKGRSSAKALHGSLRSIASNALAADILYRLIYIPSEHNPADAPSRGKRSRHPARVKRPSRNWRAETKLERHLLRLHASWNHLRKTGFVKDGLYTDGTSDSERTCSSSDL